MLDGSGPDVGELGASDGVGGEGVLCAHGAEFLAAVAVEEVVQHEQQRFRDWWEEGADECLLDWALHASEGRSVAPIPSTLPLSLPLEPSATLVTLLIIINPLFVATFWIL